MNIDPALRVVFVRRGTEPNVGAVWCFTCAVRRILNEPPWVAPFVPKITDVQFSCTDCTE